MQIKFKRLSSNVPMPEYKTAGAVAFDLSVTESGVLAPGESRLFPTGLVVEVPEGYALILVPRSSNAKKKVKFANGIGIIDQDYHGPTDQLFLALHNFGSESYTVEKGERIGQGMFVPVLKGEFIETEDMNTFDRGGFGTTG